MVTVIVTRYTSHREFDAHLSPGKQLKNEDIWEDLVLK